MEIIYAIFAVLFWLYFLTFIGLGFYQPISAIIRLLSVKRKDSPYAIGLKKYLLAVSFYLLIFFSGASMKIGHGWFALTSIYTFIVPLFFAIWYFKFIRKWKKKRKNIREFDRQLLINAPHPDRLLLESFPKKKLQLQSSLIGKQKVEKKEARILSLPILTKAK